VPQQVAHVFAQRQGLLRVKTMFQSILIALRGAGSWGTAVHPASLLSRDSRGQAWRAFAGFGATSEALSHRRCVSRVGHSGLIGSPAFRRLLFDCTNRLRHILQVLNGFRMF